LASRDVGLIAMLGKPRVRLALDSTALAPLTMRSGGVQRHASAAAGLTRLLLPGGDSMCTVLRIRPVRIL
jgi:hypothetical protein